MKLSLAKIISYIFNPLILACVAPFYLVYKTTYDSGMALYWTFYTMVFMAMIFGFIVLGVKKEFFTDLDISRREQRKKVYIVALICCSVYFISLFYLAAPVILRFVTAAALCLIVILNFMNKYIKTSIHMTVVTALFSNMAFNFGKFYYLLLLVIPVVAWARLKTKRHTKPELAVGSAVGLFISMLIFFVEKYLIK